MNQTREQVQAALANLKVSDEQVAQIEAMFREHIVACISIVNQPAPTTVVGAFQRKALELVLCYLARDARKQSRDAAIAQLVDPLR